MGVASTKMLISTSKLNMAILFPSRHFRASHALHRQAIWAVFGHGGRCSNWLRFCHFYTFRPVIAPSGGQYVSSFSSDQGAWASTSLPGFVKIGMAVGPKQEMSSLAPPFGLIKTIMRRPPQGMGGDTVPKCCGVWFNHWEVILLYVISHALCNIH